MPQGCYVVNTPNWLTDEALRIRACRLRNCDDPACLCRGGFTSTIKDTGVISVQGAGLQMTRMGSEFSASGYGAGTVTATPTTNNAGVTTTEYTVTNTTNGAPFSLEGSSRAADAQGQAFTVGLAGVSSVVNNVTTVSPTENTGAASSVNLYGNVTIQYAGTAGTGTGVTSSLNGTTTTGPTVIAGSGAGPVITVGKDAQGVTVLGSREIQLTIFD